MKIPFLSFFERKQNVIDTESKNFIRGSAIVSKCKSLGTNVPVLVVISGNFFSKKKRKLYVVIVKEIEWDDFHQFVVLTPYIKQTISKKLPIKLETAAFQDKMNISFEFGKHNHIIIGTDNITAYLLKKHLGPDIISQISFMKYLMQGFGRFFKEYPEFNTETDLTLY